MPIQIQQLKADAETKVFGLIAGKAGIGKTTQATTFPMKETLIVSLEKGLLSIKGSNYAAVEIETYDQLIETIMNVQKECPWVKYLFIDSLSEIYDLINREVRQKFTAKQNFAKFEEKNDKLFYAIRLAKQLAISCFFVCHTKEEKDGLSLQENLAFDGKMPEDIKKQFDLIIHMTKQDDENGISHRVFACSPDVSNVAKKRESPWLKIDIKDIEEPNLYKLCLKLTGQS